MTLYPQAAIAGKRVVTCRPGGWKNDYGAMYLPMDIVSKYRLLGPVEIIEDEENHQIILKKFTPKAEPIDK